MKPVSLIALLFVFAALTPAIADPGRIPTGQILAPAGESVLLDGTMAANVVRIPGKPWVAVICSGERQSLSVVDVKAGRVLCAVPFQKLNGAATGYQTTGDAYYGIAVSPDGKTLYASRGSEDRVATYRINDDGTLSESASYYEPPPGPHRANFISGVAIDPVDRKIYAVNNLTDTVAMFPLEAGTPPSPRPNSGDTTGSVAPTEYPVGGYPLAVAVDVKAGKTYVSSERDSALSVVKTGPSSDLDGQTTIPVGSHPDALLVSADGRRLFAANGDSDSVTIIDTSTDEVIRTILLRPTSAGGLPGATPTGLCLSPDQRTLYVTLADMNAVAVVTLDKATTDGRVIGYIPTGWYPSALTMNAAGTQLIVANAKGCTANVPNPHGPNPVNHNNIQYIHFLLSSTLSLIPVPTAAKLQTMTKTVLADNSIDAPLDRDSVQSTRLLPSLPIKHVIYIIKENRTYDEVLGDLPGANGDPSLVLFGKRITPNLHALSTSFVTFDNFYCCAEVSADGWNWSTSGFANEYVQRSVPENYSERDGTARPGVRGYDYEGSNRGIAVSDRGIPDVAESPGGYIWDSIKKAGETYRDYGAFLSEDGDRPAKPALLNNTDYNFSYFDLKYADSDIYYTSGLPSPGKSAFGPDKAPSRYSAWKSEFDRYCANGNLPSFELVRFMRDHTAGTTVGANTPQAMAADNDYAVGELVDSVSHSRYWKSTAVFVVEDDAQNGPDHVDCHRSTCYVISPYVRHGFVDHRFYNTDSVLRSIELILHTPAMTRLDQSARPIAAFTPNPDFTAFTAIKPDMTVIGGVNTADAYGAQLSTAMDFAVADDVPEDALNRVLWYSIKGVDHPLPEPRRSVLGQ